MMNARKRDQVVRADAENLKSELDQTRKERGDVNITYNEKSSYGLLQK